jgi:type II secretory pathway pseudopilin PulG
MNLKGLAITAVLLTLMHAPTAADAQANIRAGANRQTPPVSTPSTTAPPVASSPTPNFDSGSGASSEPVPHITVANPPPTPLAWALHDKITWAATVVLAILGYVGILLALSLLKKIDRQTGYAETAAEAAAASAQAALLNAQALIHSERPWVLMTVEPSRSVENSFTVMATNRGRTPARIIATTNGSKIAIDEKHLPSTPEYKEQKTDAPLTPIILLPGESTPIEPFCRDDVRGLCDSEERYRRIETWEERVFLYGKVTYRDLIAPADSQLHETNWCCWYIHGRQNSGLVIAGPPEYNSHT